MKADFFDFEWLRDSKGYSLESAIKPSTRKPKSTSDLLLSSDFTSRPAKIIRRGGELKSYHPRLVEKLHREFMNMNPSERGVSEFINSFGFLGLTTEGARAQSESVDTILEAQSNLRDAMEVFESINKLEKRHLRAQHELADYTDNIEIKRGEYINLISGFFNQWAQASLKVNLKFIMTEKGPSFDLVAKPTSLISCIWLQLAEELSGVAFCEYCGKPFKQKRSNNTTCSTSCRTNLSRLNKKLTAAKTMETPLKGSPK